MTILEIVILLIIINFVCGIINMVLAIIFIKSDDTIEKYYDFWSMLVVGPIGFIRLAKDLKQEKEK